MLFRSKKMIIKEGTAKERVDTLVAALKNDGYDFTVGIPADTPIVNAERVVSAGKGIGPKSNMKLIEDLAENAGAAIGSSRPVAETLKYLPIDRYVGMSGQKFTGNLYIACGISGAGPDFAKLLGASRWFVYHGRGRADGGTAHFVSVLRRGRAQMA